jgi:hypothetical protein
LMVLNMGKSIDLLMNEDFVTHRQRRSGSWQSNCLSPASGDKVVRWQIHGFNIFQPSHDSNHPDLGQRRPDSILQSCGYHVSLLIWGLCSREKKVAENDQRREPQKNL